MLEHRNNHEFEALGLGVNITRRDFINTSLSGSGAAFLGVQARSLI